MPQRNTLYYRNVEDGYEMVLIPGGSAIFGTEPEDPSAIGQA